MKAASFEYLRPSSCEEAVRALAEAGGSAKLLAGGQSLGPMLNLRLARPALLVDVSRLEALRGVRVEADRVVIGASTSHAALEDGAGGLAPDDMLVRVAAGIAYRAVRNRGTVGGSLAHADPAADWPLALAALGATIVIRGPRGARRVEAAGFMRAAFTTVLEDDEIVESVEVPRLSSAARWGYFKFCRKTGEFPEASAAVVFDPERRTARAFVGALHGAPMSLGALARDAAGLGAAAVSTRSLDQAIAAGAPGLDAIERRMHIAAARRAFAQALA